MCFCSVKMVFVRPNLFDYFLVIFGKTQTEMVDYSKWDEWAKTVSDEEKETMDFSRELSKMAYEEVHGKPMTLSDTPDTPDISDVPDTAPDATDITPDPEVSAETTKFDKK